MRLKFFIVVIASTFLIVSHAQKVDSDTLINSIKAEITSFFIKQKVLKSDEVNGSLKAVYATELKEQKVLGYNKIGVYSIGVFQSHSEHHILIKENDSFKIFGLKEIDTVLKSIIEYAERNNLKPDEMLFYVKAAIEMYDVNYKRNPNGGVK